MGTTKTEIFSPEQNNIASIAKVLAHPARIAIIELLSRTEGCVCGEIVDEIGLAQATISQHLKELKKAGIIKGNIDGTSVCYCIDYNNLNTVKEILNSFLSIEPSICTQNTDCC